MPQPVVMINEQMYHLHNGVVGGVHVGVQGEAALAVAVEGSIPTFKCYTFLVYLRKPQKRLFFVVGALNKKSPKKG